MVKEKKEQDHYYGLGARIRSLRLGWYPWTKCRAWVRISDLRHNRWCIQFWPGDRMLPGSTYAKEYRKLTNDEVFQFFPFATIKAIKKPFNLIVDENGRPS